MDSATERRAKRGLSQLRPGCADVKEPGAAVAAGPGSRQTVLQPLDDGGVGLAAALAHGLQAVPAARALKLVEQLGQQDRPGSAERVAQRDRAAVRVGLL